MHDDLLLVSIGLVLILKSEKHKTEPATTLGLLVTHHDGVVDATVLREVLVEIIFMRVEGQASDKQFDLILLSRLMERSCRVALVGAGAHSHLTEAAQAWHAAHTEERVD